MWGIRKKTEFISYTRTYCEVFWGMIFFNVLHWQIHMPELLYFNIQNILNGAYII